jgi:hypothetical protein
MTSAQIFPNFAFFINKRHQYCVKNIKLRTKIKMALYAMVHLGLECMWWIFSFFRMEPNQVLV